MTQKTPAAQAAKKPGKAAPKEPVKLVSFAVSAVIPTQQYGNIQPRIEVVAPTIEAAREAVMPVMESLYRQYAEAPLSGKEPRFYGKVTEEVKVVVPEAKPEAPVAPAAEEPKPTGAPEAPAAPAPAAKPEPVLKAEKAIAVAATLDAILAIGAQIEKSVKIPQEYKDPLAVLVLKRRKALGDTGQVTAK
jgi:hypothetical protein